MGNRTIKVFIACSGEMEDDRKEVKLLLNEYKFDELNQEGFSLKTVDWTGLSHSHKKDRIQNSFTKEMLDCEIVIVLFHKKVGEFTKEEFDRAYEELRKENKSYHLYVYFKKYTLSSDELDDDKISKEVENLRNLKKHIQATQQLPLSYENVADLKGQLSTQLDIAISQIKERPLKDDQGDIVDSVRRKVEERKESFEPMRFEIKLRIHSRIPNRDPNFTGRREMVTTLLKRLANREMVMVSSSGGVFGMGGIGKTALVTEVCNLFQCSWENTPRFYSDDTRNREVGKILGSRKWFGDGILWIKFEKDQSWKKLLEEEVFQQLGLSLDDLEKAESWLAEVLHEKNILVVLDSAEQHEENFKRLYKLFHRFPRLVTSRKHLGMVDPLDLTVMQPDEAIELFCRYLHRTSKEVERKEIDTLCEKMGHLPLAIKIMAVRGNKFNRSLGQLHEDFDQMQCRMEEEYEEGGGVRQPERLFSLLPLL